MSSGEWRRFANEIAGTFKVNTSTCTATQTLSEDTLRIGAPLGPSTIAYFSTTPTFYRSLYGHQDSWTTISAVLPFVFLNGFTFDIAVGDINWLYRLGKTLMQHSGSSVKFHAWTNDKGKLQTIFGDSPPVDRLAALNPCTFRIMRKKDEGCSSILPGRLAVLAFAASREGRCARIEELRNIHELFKATFDSLVNEGTASMELPEFFCEMVMNSLCRITYGPWNKQSGSKS